MTCRVILMPRAESDRDRIYGYTVKHWGKMRAQQWYDKLDAALLTLETLPERCPVAPESEDATQPIRQIIRPPFRILFRIKKKQVQVIHIRHAARLPVGGSGAGKTPL